MVGMEGGGGGGQLDDGRIAAVAGLAQQQVQAAAVAAGLAHQGEELRQSIGVVRVVHEDLHAAAQDPALQAAGIVAVVAAEAGQHRGDRGRGDSQPQRGERGAGAVLQVVRGQAAQGQRHVGHCAQVVRGAAIE